ncbi:MAG: hypothetical protein IJT31_03690 [Oscillibacter sp.]|nr:hypothetical protein [Oscillibacter sp.]
MDTGDITTLVNAANILSQAIFDKKFITACFGVAGACAGQYMTGFLPENLGLDRTGLKLMGGMGGLGFTVLIAKQCFQYANDQTLIIDQIEQKQITGDVDDVSEAA